MHHLFLLLSIVLCPFRTLTHNIFCGRWTLASAAIALNHPPHKRSPACGWRATCRHISFLLIPEPDPWNSVIQQWKGKKKICLRGGNLEQDQAHFTGKILTFQPSPSEFLADTLNPVSTQVDHTPDASPKLLCQGVRCSLGYQRWSSMQMRTLSSPICLPLIMTPIKDSRQRGVSAIVIATQ